MLTRFSAVPSDDSLVVFAQQQADVVEVGSLRRLFGPTALHELTQLRAVTLRVDGGPQAGPLPQNHPVHDFCRHTGTLTLKPGSRTGENQGILAVDSSLLQKQKTWLFFCCSVFFFCSN